jgi:DNA primase
MASKFRYSNFVDRIDIDELEVALNFESTEQDGRGNDIGHCPLPWGLHKHGDTTGKFAIHRDKKVYNCWVCGGGSLLDLAMAINDQTEEEAIEWLFQFTKPAEETGEKFKQRIQDKLAPKEQAKSVLPYYNPRILDKWTGKYDPWFSERGITEAAVDWLKLGFAEETVKYAPKKGGVPIDQPYHGPAIILPHFFKGQLVGWQHRWLDDDRPKWCNKYTNTTDFPRSQTLWGYDIASKTPIVPTVVESVPTAAFLITIGYPTMATFGSAVNEAQIKLLRTFTQGVRLAPDKGDTEKYWKAAGQLQRYVPVSWVNPPDELADREDLGDLVSTPHLVRNCIEDAPWLFASTKASRIPRS